MGRIFSPLLVLMALTLSPAKAQEPVYFADPDLKAAVQEEYQVVGTCPGQTRTKAS